MTSERGFFAELLNRRVPQILGLYIGGVWLCIEIGQWLAEEFAVPARLPAYLFVFLVLLVPSIALIAWVHGAPGKDRVTPLERIFVPLNVLVALTALLVVPPKVAGEADSAVVAEVDVAQDVEPQARSIRVLVFSFRNETASDPDWYGYGFPILLGEDMTRASSAFQVSSVIESDNQTEYLRRRGFARGVGEPASIQTEIATKTGFRLLVRGAIQDDPDTGELMVAYSLVQTNDGVEILGGTVPFQRDDPLTAADTMSAEIQEYLAETLGEDVVERRDSLLAESFTPSAEALRHYVDAFVSLRVEVDGAALMTSLEQAIEIDPQFAEARANRAIGLFLTGNNPDALTEIEEALRADYRLSRSSRFTLQINKAMILQDPLRAVDIAKTWVETQSNNERAYRRLAEVLGIASIELDEALAAYERVREINPNASDTLLSSAAIERQRGNLESAVEYTERFLLERPDSFEARLNLAEIRLAQTDFDAALAEFERAGYLDSQSIAPQLGAIQALMQQGSFALAEDRLEQIKQRSLTDAQRLSAMNTARSLYELRGQMTAAVKEMRDIDPIARRTMNPLVYLVQIKAPAIAMEAHYTSDIEPIIDRLAALREDAQPPWDSFLYWYDMTPYQLHGYEERYHDAKERVSEFLLNSGNANMQMMILTAEAQDALYQGDNEAAVGQIDEALQLTRQSLLNLLATTELATMRAGMYDILRQAGEQSRAIEGLAALVTQFPGHALAHLRLAQAYFEMGDRSKSREFLDIALGIWQDADATYVYFLEAMALQEQLASEA
ncbi:MAG: tetratricopeptide repeat protein [Pseudomonadota bacterium]